MTVQDQTATQRRRTPGALSPQLDRIIPNADTALAGRREFEPATVGALWNRQSLRRAEILRQARILIGHQGYAGFSIRKVAENSEVAPQTVYNLLGDREQVLETAIGQHVAAMITAARKLTASTGASQPASSQRTSAPPGFFMSLADVLWGHALKNSDYTRIVIQAQFTTRSIPTHKIQGVLTAAYRTELNKLALDGQLRSGIDTNLVADCMQAGVTMTAFRWADDHDDDLLLRRQVVTSLGLPLIGAMTAIARRPVEIWMDAIQATSSD